MNKKSDNELIKEVLSGSDISFRILRDRYSLRLVEYVIYKFKYSVQEAEDIVNKVFIKIYNNKFKKYHFNSKFSTYIYSSVINESISLIKSYKKRNVVTLEDKHNIKSEIFENKFENKELIEFLLNQLSDEERALIESRYYLSYKEISEITGVKENTLRANYKRAKDKLENMAKKTNINPEDLLL